MGHFRWALCAVVGLSATKASGQSFVVNSTADTGAAGTLRWAIGQANAHGGAAAIDIQAGLGTITLGSELPILLNPNGITIHGNGATIDGGSTSNTTGYRVFFAGVGTGESAAATGFGSLVATTNTNWSISNLSIANGNARGGNTFRSGGAGAGLGGAIFVNAGHLDLAGVNFSNNRAVGGSVNTSVGGVGGGGMGGNGSNGGGGFGLGADGGGGNGAFTGGAPGGNGGLHGGGGDNGSGGNNNGGGGVGGTVGGGSVGGNGGFGGGGGGANSGGGNGGFGGGGGNGASQGGNGGFGGGGGRSSAGTPGAAGFGGGAGGGASGGGGAGLGGAILIRQGATLSITDGGVSGGIVQGGTGGANDGQAIGSAFFLAGAATYSVSTGNTITINDTIGGGTDAQITGGFTKSGPGTLVLSGANSYTGGTTVSGGTLLANNASGSAGAGSVTVDNGGTFGGTGAISGAVTINSGGTIAPGASIETLATGSQTWLAGGIYEFEASDASNAPGTHDQINMVNLTAATTGQFTIKVIEVGSGPLTHFQWITIATGTGTLTDFNPGDFTFDGPAPHYDIQQVPGGSGGFSIQIQANPEPGTTLLFGTGVSALLLGRWRRSSGLNS